jgi:hypothetical protein
MSFQIKDGWTVGTASLHSSAITQVNSTSKGVLDVPRMTKAERLAIVGPATGLQVYQTDELKGFYHYNGTTWIAGLQYVDSIGGWADLYDDYNNGQASNQSGVVGSDLIQANTFYFVPTMLQGSISEFCISITALSGANIVVGLYDSDAGGVPANLIWQSVAYNTTGVKQSAGLSLNLTRGRYWFAFLSDASTVRLRTFLATGMFPFLGMDSTLTANQNRRVVSGAYAYTATLPSVAPTTVYGSGAFIIPTLFFKK